MTVKTEIKANVDSILFIKSNVIKLKKLILNLFFRGPAENFRERLPHHRLKNIGVGDTKNNFNKLPVNEPQNIYF